MPLINFTNPYFLVLAVILFVACVFISKNMKTNTVPCIMLLVFLAILVGHTIELSSIHDAANTVVLTICIVVDEAFTFASFLTFLWLDKIQIDTAMKNKKGKKQAIIKSDGLEILWKQV